MLYKCFSCGQLTLNSICERCTVEGERYRPTPIDPMDYHDWTLTRPSLLESIYHPKRQEAEERLHQRAEAVLEQYEKYRDPYFNNFVHLTRGGYSGFAPPKYTDTQLLRTLLVRMGFEELNDHSGLTEKLVRTTRLRLEYEQAKPRLQRHVAIDLEDTLQEWIRQEGPAYQAKLPLLLYFLYKHEHHADQIAFESEDRLVSEAEEERISDLCERIYYNICARRLRRSLEEFDASESVSMIEVDAMSGEKFESFVADLFGALGYEAETTSISGDQGVDVLLRGDGRRLAVQAKNYGGNVGNRAVQEALAGQRHYSCDQAIVVTNSEFTASALELAETTDVTLVGRDQLRSYLERYNRQSQ